MGIYTLPGPTRIDTYPVTLALFSMMDGSRNMESGKYGVGNLNKSKSIVLKMGDSPFVVWANRPQN